MSTGRKIICSPVFTKREFPAQDSILCFVIMPFSIPLLEDVYRNTVKPTVESFGFGCIRSDDIYSVGSIIEDIWSAMCRAQFVIGEFTGRNPNVLYEAGVAHTLGKPLICITQEINDIPFDFRHIRHVVYENSPTGYRELEERLKKTISALLETPFIRLPRPYEAPSEELARLTGALVEERRRTTQLYLAVEERILRQHEHFHKKIAQLKRVPSTSKNYFETMAFCHVEGCEVSVDFYSEEDRRIVTIAEEYVSDFYISKYPITNTQYQVFVDDTGHSYPEHWIEGKPPEGREDHPVIGVSWVDVTAFCDWLSQISEKSIQIPTEAQWLAAAGYGLDKRRYPWGNHWKKQACNSREYGVGDTTPVAAFEGKGDSPYGCVDMLGNVWEWTVNRFQYRDSEGFAWRAVRGGAQYSALRNVGSLARLVAFPGHFLFVQDLGLRMVYEEGDASIES